MLKFHPNWCRSKRDISNQNWVYKSRKLFLFKQLVRELGEIDLPEFFSQHLDSIDVSSVKILCRFV